MIKSVNQISSRDFSTFFLHLQCVKNMLRTFFVWPDPVLQ